MNKPYQNAAARQGKIVRKLIVALVLLVVVGGAVFGVSYIDFMVQRGIERGTTRSLNLDTQLGNADLSLLGGKLGLNNLTIAQPEGFSGKLFAVDDANVQVSYGNLLSDPVRVADVNITRPTLNLSEKGGRLNIMKLRDLLEQAPETDPNQEPLKVIIDSLTVTEPRVVIESSLLSGGPRTITLPTFTLKNIGNAEEAQNGVELGKVGVEVITAMAAQALEDGGLPAELQQLLSGDVQALIDNAVPELKARLGDVVSDKLGKELGGLLGEGGAENITGRAADEIGRGLGDLLGGNRKPPEEKE